ncbi:carbohydrate esterase family 16 protein [Apodospora peruviana]|uniref:Carbohydrate esterase family 16 protein n=1 Tax=Apodospora peruviana TaxID=516989 RepID=A0AAE0LZP6_9PEZI|nr:carbohydrate esterase family 16 protein [Apodospora peruviana]
MASSIPSRVLSVLLLGGAVANAAQGLWQQCGGIGYSGETSCATGAVCTLWNDWYAQCVPGPTTTAVPTTKSTTAIPTPVTTTTTSSIITTTSAAAATSSTAAAPSSVQYLISFGDSYSQTGFNINSTKPAPGNPFGNPPLPGWTASGGLNWVGFLTATYNRSTLLTYNFAYGGATTNASLVTPWQPTVLSFIDQVAQFSGSIASHPSYAPWTSANSLFAVWMGVNDVGNSWWEADYATKVERIMDTYFGQLQVLYDAGARNFLLLSVPPIYKTPAVIAQGEATQQSEKAAIATYNGAIATRLAAFKTQNSGVEGKILDTEVPFNTALENPTSYGSPNATCYNEDGKSCLWFNDYHPGVKINQLVASAAAKLWGAPFFQ